ncbi:MAG TPA: zinc-ribbon domain-containing protein, partial [Pirellulaceae bacterium]|nr:zinc-ribbon domain-containing protein [Pirellulaceae bacterium]
MIIWGSTGREVNVGQGDFHCPQCDSQQRFFHNRIARYFTLYFIPLFQISSHGDFITCTRCSGQFTMEVLNYRPPSSSERLAAMLRGDLDSGMPLHMAQQKL